MLLDIDAEPAKLGRALQFAKHAIRIMRISEAKKKQHIDVLDKIVNARIGQSSLFAPVTPGIHGQGFAEDLVGKIPSEKNPHFFDGDERLRNISPHVMNPKELRRHFGVDL